MVPAIRAIQIKGIGQIYLREITTNGKIMGLTIKIDLLGPKEAIEG